MTRTYYTCRAISRRGQSQLHQDHQDDRAVPSPGGQTFVKLFIMDDSRCLPKRNQFPNEKAGRGLYIFPFLSFLKNIFPHAWEKAERSHSSPHFLTRDCAVLVLHNRGKMDFLNLSLSCRIRSFVAHLVKEIENLLVRLGLLEKLCPTLLFAN